MISFRDFYLTIISLKLIIKISHACKEAAVMSTENMSFLLFLITHSCLFLTAWWVVNQDSLFVTRNRFEKAFHALAAIPYAMYRIFVMEGLYHVVPKGVTYWLLFGLFLLVGYFGFLWIAGWIRDRLEETPKSDWPSRRGGFR